MSAESATTIPDWLRGITREHGDAPCLRGEIGTLTYRELDDASSALARGLLARGVGKATRVGLLMGNGPEWAIWWAAISRIGSVCVPLSTFAQPPELARVVRHADLHGLVASREFLGRRFDAALVEALPDLANAADPHLALADAPFLRWIVIPGADTRWCHDRDWIADAGHGDRWADVLTGAEQAVDADDEALVIYTSGQSAEPKGVVHVQNTIVLKARYLRDMYQFTSTTAVEITLPFFWVGGLTMGMLPALAAGGCCTCTERSTWGTGSVIGSTNVAGNSYGEFRMFPALGMTETFGIFSWGEEFRAPDHPICSPLDAYQPGFEVRVVGEDGRDVPDGGIGEIIVRGPTVARRLHKVPRDEVFDADGYYRTGDRGLREGARIHFMGRMRDMIKTSGANVSPAEVEQELVKIDGVIAAHVVGIDDRVRDQIVGAAIVIDDRSGLTTEDVQARLRARLSNYKVPRAIAFFPSIDAIPMTPSLKVRKRELAALIRSVVQGT